MRLLRGNYIQNGMLAKLYTEIQCDGYCRSRWLLDSSDSQVVRATAFFVESTAGCVGALYLEEPQYPRESSAKQRKLRAAPCCYCFYKNNEKEETYLVAVVVVAGNVDFRPMSCTSDGLHCSPDLENRPRIGEQAEYRGRRCAGTTQLSDFSTGARPRLRRGPRHSVGICNKLHNFNGLAVPLFEQESSAVEDNRTSGLCGRWI